MIDSLGCGSIVFFVSYIVIAMATDDYKVGMALGIILGIAAFFLMIKHKIDKISEEEQEIEDKKSNITSNASDYRSVLESSGIEPEKTLNYITPDLDVSYSVGIDTIARKIVISDNIYGSVDTLDFDSLIQCDILQNNAVVHHSGTGTALAGAIIGGTQGAIIGATGNASADMAMSLEVRIITKDVLSPTVRMKLLARPIRRSDYEYQKAMRYADDVFATITAVINNK